MIANSYVCGHRRVQSREEAQLHLSIARADLRAYSGRPLPSPQPIESPEAERVGAVERTLAQLEGLIISLDDVAGWFEAPRPAPTIPLPPIPKEGDAKK